MHVEKDRFFFKILSEEFTCDTVFFGDGVLLSSSVGCLRYINMFLRIWHWALGWSVFNFLYGEVEDMNFKTQVSRKNRKKNLKFWRFF